MDYEGMLVVSVVSIIIFLLLREVNCWYWKINEAVDLLRDIRDLLNNSVYLENEANIEKSEIYDDSLNE